MNHIQREVPRTGQEREQHGVQKPSRRQQQRMQQQVSIQESLTGAAHSSAAASDLATNPSLLPIPGHVLGGNDSAAGSRGGSRNASRSNSRARKNNNNTGRTQEFEFRDGGEADGDIDAEALNASKADDIKNLLDLQIDYLVNGRKVGRNAPGREARANGWKTLSYLLRKQVSPQSLEIWSEGLLPVLKKAIGKSDDDQEVIAALEGESWRVVFNVVDMVCMR